MIRIAGILTPAFLERRPAAAARNAAAAVPARLSLTRAFVETGDERCPLAGIWSALPLTDTADDDPGLPRPVMGALLAWRALHRTLTLAL
jgi:hypothetical protein